MSLEVFTETREKKFALKVKEYISIPSAGIYKKSEGSFEHLHFIPQTIRQEFLTIKLLPDYIFELPIEFKDSTLLNEIDKSKKILSYKDNWDGEGTKAYKKDTFINAISFLIQYTKWIWEEKQCAIPSPKILSGAEGTIDLYWKKDNFDLLITVPEYPKVMASFYGDDKKEAFIEGRFNIKKYNQGIFLCLLNL